MALQVGQGVDPEVAEKERRRQAVDLAFASYVDLFATGYLEARWKGVTQATRLLAREAVPVLKATALPLIKRSDITAVLDRLSDRPASAKLLHATLRKLFRWAVSRGDLERSPMEGMEAPEGAAARDRVLPDAELAAVWSASAKLGYPFAPLFRILIATGQRREEVSDLDWSEVDRCAALWTLPAARAKNAKAHIVPLNDLAVAELDGIAIMLGSDPADVSWPKRGKVFSTTGKTAVSGHSKAKARLDRLIEDAGDDLPGWRIHDLRRTLATGMQRLGVRFEVTEAILNHVSGARSGVAGVYQRHDWAAEKRTALDAWARHVEAALAPAAETNVRAIGRRAA